MHFTFEVLLEHLVFRAHVLYGSDVADELSIGKLTRFTGADGFDKGFINENVKRLERIASCGLGITGELRERCGRGCVTSLLSLESHILRISTEVVLRILMEK